MRCYALLQLDSTRAFKTQKKHVARENCSTFRVGKVFI